MTNRVVHQEYLEAWLRGEIVELKYGSYGDWNEFTLGEYLIEAFNNPQLEFRLSNNKTVEVNLTDFYKDYDSISSANYREVLLEDLIEKYLPRPQ